MKTSCPDSKERGGCFLVRQHHKGATQLVNKFPCLWLQARPRQALVSPRAKESYTAACTSVFGRCPTKTTKALHL